MHLFYVNNGSDCSLEEFCQMIMQTAEIIGIDRLGIGSDLWENWDYSVLEWMHSCRWTMGLDHGEGSVASPSWPHQ
jgi:membrane dipeptidase